MRKPLLYTSLAFGMTVMSFFAGCAGRTSNSPKNQAALHADAMTTAHPSLLGLGFMAGSWRAMGNEGLSEEVWSVPHGSSMVGTFRMTESDGSLRMQEVLAIVAEPDGVYMRLRHFDARMVSREEKDAPIVLKLESSVARRATFRCIAGSKSLATITTWRVDQTLHSEVAFTPESGRETLKFEMQRFEARPD